MIPEVPSDDDGEDSEDETTESIARHVCVTGCKVDRDPACKPEVKAKLPPVAVAAATDNPLPATVAPFLPVDAGTAEQNSQSDGQGGGTCRPAGHGQGGRGGKRGCLVVRANYSVTELESIREHLPISGVEWDLVVENHSRIHPDLERTGDQLNKKINKLARTKSPTRQLNIPFTVQEAKAINVPNIEKAEGDTGSEEEGFAAEETIVVAQDDGAGNPTEDARAASGVNDDSVAGNSHGDEVS
jgi:hypothetical protein